MVKGTTILCVRRDGKVAIAGDGQVTMGNTVFKQNAKKTRKMYGDKLLAGFSGATADARYSKNSRVNLNPTEET